jgi:hypothetical protein
MAEMTYEVSFKGAASETLRAAFADYPVELEHGQTVIRCEPTCLDDVLERIRAFGLELLDVHLVARPAP